jgi:hypothetical protein
MSSTTHDHLETTPEEAELIAARVKAMHLRHEAEVASGERSPQSLLLFPPGYTRRELRPKFPKTAYRSSAVTSKR